MSIKSLFFMLLSVLFFVGCMNKNLTEAKISQIDHSVHWQRFDQEFMTLTADNFLQLQQKFPLFLPKNIPIDVWQKKQADSLYIDISQEVSSCFKDITVMKSQVNEVLKHIHYYFPKENTDQVVTLISEVDINSQVVYSKGLFLISLDTYLGEEHKYYSVFDAYKRSRFNSKRIPVDMAFALIDKKVKHRSNATLLDQMITIGKKQVVLDSLIPSLNDTLKFNYSAKQLAWAKANEDQIWKYFIQNKYLYDNDPKLHRRFIQEAPFSKFYLSFDNESPGSIGSFIGYQIAKSFQKREQLSINEFLQTTNQHIFIKSKYKPQKQ